MHTQAWVILPLQKHRDYQTITLHMMQAHTHFHGLAVGHAIMDEVGIYYAHISRLPLICSPTSSNKPGRGDRRLVHRGWTWTQTPACDCCCHWHCQKHNGAECCIILSFSLLPASLIQILMLHFVLVFLSGVARVITAYCLLSSPQCWTRRNVPHCGLRQGKGILLKLSPVFQLFISSLHFRGNYCEAYCLRGFFSCLLKQP